MLKYIFLWKWRDLNKFLKPLFYKWLVTKIIKQNYINLLTLENNKIKKNNGIWVIFWSNKEIELEEILLKNNNFHIWEK